MSSPFKIVLDVSCFSQDAQEAHFLWYLFPLEIIASALKTAPPHLGQFLHGSSDLRDVVSKKFKLMSNYKYYIVPKNIDTKFV